MIYNLAQIRLKALKAELAPLSDRAVLWREVSTSLWPSIPSCLNQNLGVGEAEGQKAKLSRLFGERVRRGKVGKYKDLKDLVPVRMQ